MALAGIATFLTYKYNKSFNSFCKGIFKCEGKVTNKTKDLKQGIDMLKNLTSETVENLENKNLLGYFTKSDVEQTLNSNPSNIRLVMDLSHPKCQKEGFEKLPGYNPDSKNHIATCIYNQTNKKVLQAHIFNCDSIESLNPEILTKLKNEGIFCFVDANQVPKIIDLP